MSEVLILKDGRREYITSERDFGEFLDRELGYCARDYYENVLSEHDADVGESIAVMRYEISRKLSAINQELRDYLQSKPLDAEKIESLIEKVRNMVVDLR